MPAGTSTPPLHLLERKTALVQVDRCLAGLSASPPRGGCLLVTGEAGVGKTRLLRALAARAAPTVELLYGLCEPLLSPAPWAPLLDMLDALPPSLAAQVRSGQRAQALMPDWLGWLQRRARPLVLVIDDAQWADDASLDLLRFLGRRAADLPLLLVLAWRSNELPSGHALPGVVGTLPLGGTVHAPLQPLSPRAVAEAARQRGRSAQGLFELTQGNPFLLTALLDTTEGSLPASVHDAVQGRLSHLSGPARALIELLCVSPVPVEVTVLMGLPQVDAATLEAARSSGLLQDHGDALGFRHELSRRAVEAAVPPGRRRALHAALLQALPHARLARRVHHAEGAGLHAAVLQLAPLAAAEAAQAAAHRQAQALYRLALLHVDASTPAATHARLLLAAATQHELAGALDDALLARQQAVELLQSDGQQHEQIRAAGAARSAMARLLFLRGDMAGGQRLARQAIQSLEALGEPDELAMAYAVLAQLHLLDATPGAARDWAHRALAIAVPRGDLAAQVHALNTLASAELTAADLPEAWARLDQSEALAQQQGWHEGVARAITNRVVHQMAHRRHDLWPGACSDGLAWCEARDLDLYALRLRLRRAYGWLETGRWDAAATELDELLRRTDLVPMDRQQAQYLRATLGLRRGEAAARQWWTALLNGSEQLQPQPWYAPLPVAAAEAAWLLGRRSDLLKTVQAALPECVASGEPWRSGQLAVWLHRLDALDHEPAMALAAPCAAELRHDLDAAAMAWAAAGNPWEQALCLLGGDVEQLRRSLALLNDLGAQPAAALARRRLREAGHARGLRGRNRSTRSDPLGLTPRERRLLGALATGLSYRQIGAQWHRSPRTVEHHARSLLGKLGLASRYDVPAYLDAHGAMASDAG